MAGASRSPDSFRPVTASRLEDRPRTETLLRLPGRRGSRSRGLDMGGLGEGCPGERGIPVTSFASASCAAEISAGVSARPKAMRSNCARVREFSSSPVMLATVTPGPRKRVVGGVIAQIRKSVKE